MMGISLILGFVLATIKSFGASTTITSIKIFLFLSLTGRSSSYRDRGDFGKRFLLLKDYVADSTAVLKLPAEAIYWIYLFTHQDLYT